MFSRVSSIAGPVSPFRRIQPVTRGLQLYLDSGVPGSYGGSGTNWKDLSGNSRDMTLFNGPTYTSTTGGILSFASGSFQYALGSYGMGNLTTFTVESWVRFNGNPPAGTGAIFTNSYDGLNLNFSLGSNEPSSPTIVAGFFDGAWHNTTTGLAPVLGNWYHLVGTYDGSTVRIYSNNSSIGTVSYAGTPAQGSAEYRIARRWDAFDNDPVNFMHAAIPVVRVYNRALSTTEISQNFNYSRSRYGV